MWALFFVFIPFLIWAYLGLKLAYSVEEDGFWSLLLGMGLGPSVLFCGLLQHYGVIDKTEWLAVFATLCGGYLAAITVFAIIDAICGSSIGK